MGLVAHSAQRLALAAEIVDLRLHARE